MDPLVSFYILAENGTSFVCSGSRKCTFRGINCSGYVLKTCGYLPRAAQIEFLRTAVSGGSPTTVKGKTYPNFGGDGLKTVTYLRNDRSNCFLPMLYGTFSAIEAGTAGGGIWQETEEEETGSEWRMEAREEEGELKS